MALIQSAVSYAVFVLNLECMKEEKRVSLPISCGKVFTMKTCCLSLTPLSVAL